MTQKSQWDNGAQFCQGKAEKLEIRKTQRTRQNMWCESFLERVGHKAKLRECDCVVAVVVAKWADWKRGESIRDY